MANIRRLLSADIHMDTTSEEQILTSDEYKPSQKIPIWKYLAKSLSSRRALMVVLVIYTSCLFQGEVLIQMYAKPLFEEAVPSMTSTLSTMIFGIIMVGGGFFGAYLVDTAGRRILLIISSVVTCIVCVVLGTNIQLSWGPNWLNAFFLYLYSITYSVGPRTVPIVLMAEVFLPEIKSFPSMVCVEWSFICTFIVLFIFNQLISVFGLGPLFYLFTCFSLFTAIFCYIYLPETNGLPVDVIQQKFLQM